MTAGGSDEEPRERLETEIAERLDGFMSILGVLFLLLVLAEALVPRRPVLGTVFTVAGWVIWALFVAEFVARLVIAPSTSRFLRRNWWQLIFLVLPFLRFLRLLRLSRVARAGRVVSSAVRGSRTAGRTLTGRLARLVAIHAVVVLSSAQLLFEYGGVRSFLEALHLAALASVAGEPFARESVVAKALEVFLAVYSVAVFGTVAGTVGAYLLEKREDRGAADASGERSLTP